MASTLLNKLRQSIFPDFPRGSNIANQDGSMTPAWHLALSNLFQNLQSTFSNEGYSLPYLSSSDLDDIKAIYTRLIGKTLSHTNPTTPNISGKIVYDVDNEVPKVFIIEFETKGDPSSQILGTTTTPAGNDPTWKTFTIT